MEKPGLWEYLVHSATEMFKTLDGYNMVINYPELHTIRTHASYHVSYRFCLQRKMIYQFNSFECVLGFRTCLTFIEVDRSIEIIYVAVVSVWETRMCTFRGMLL